MDWENAKRNLYGWTSSTARELRAGIERLESHVAELRTGLATVRRERDAARALAAERLASGQTWMDRAIIAENRLIENSHEGRKILAEFARVDNVPGIGNVPLAAFVLPEQARLVVDWFLSSRNNPMIQAADRARSAGLRLDLAAVRAERDELKDELERSRSLLEKRTRELDVAKGRISTLEGEAQTIEVTLVDRKGFERRISAQRRDALPTICFPTPTGVATFRHVHGNIYREV